MYRGAEQLGLVAELMCRSAYRSYPLACLDAWIRPAIEHEQIHFLFDHEGVPLAYWTWAMLAPDVEARWISDPDVVLHISEWNEGDRLWIMDLVCQRGYLKSVIHYLRNHMFPERHEAFSLRRSRDGSVRKVTAWHRSRQIRALAGKNTHIKIMPPESFSSSRTDYLDAGKVTHL